jgi:glucokinase
MDANGRTAMLIAGDIGGTKTELGLFSNEAGPHRPLTQTRVRSADYASLESIVKEFLATAKEPVDRACFAIAGPVIGGRVKATNLPWVIEEASLAQELHLNLKRVHLINDLEAIARAVPTLRPSDVQTINSGTPVPRGAIGIIAPGTGLGESFLTWDGSRYLAHSSEGGHADFAPTDERQIRLLEHLFRKYDHVSFEQVCSGIGIPHIYKYLRDVEHIREDASVATRIASADDATAVIVNHALDSENLSELCVATIATFFAILASEAGNLALKVLATGGVYLAGGVVVHALPALQKASFMRFFTRKGRFSELMERIPIHAVISHAGLAGAAVRGLEDPRDA